MEEVPGPPARLEIEVRELSVKHTVTSSSFSDGRTRPPGLPSRIKRERMRELLEEKLTRERR